MLLGKVIFLLGKVIFLLGKVIFYWARSFNPKSLLLKLEHVLGCARAGAACRHAQLKVWFKDSGRLIPETGRRPRINRVCSTGVGVFLSPSIRTLRATRIFSPACALHLPVAMRARLSFPRSQKRTSTCSEDRLQQRACSRPIIEYHRIFRARLDSGNPLASSP